MRHFTSAKYQKIIKNICLYSGVDERHKQKRQEAEKNEMKWAETSHIDHLDIRLLELAFDNRQQPINDLPVLSYKQSYSKVLSRVSRYFKYAYNSRYQAEGVIPFSTDNLKLTAL